MASGSREPNQADRDRVITALSEAFAGGVVDLEELERRVTDVQHATTSAELVRLWPEGEAGAGAGTSLAPAARAGAAGSTEGLVPASRVKPKGTMISVLGSNRRTGTWTPPRSMRVTAVLGNVELDFREARMPAGPVEITVVGALGNVEILVPPALPVEVEGLAVLGNFDHVDRVPATPDPDAPLLRIRGVAVLGNVDVKMRLPGETERDEHARRKRERQGGRAGQRRLRD